MSHEILAVASELGVRGGHLGDGITFLFLAFFFVWLGRKQKKPKKILGIDYPIFAYLVALFLLLYGVWNIYTGLF